MAALLSIDLFLLLKRNNLEILINKLFSSLCRYLYPLLVIGLGFLVFLPMMVQTQVAYWILKKSCFEACLHQIGVFMPETFRI